MLTQLLTWIMIAVAVCNCRSDDGKVFFINEVRLAKGGFDAKLVSSIDDYQMNMIGPDGKRKKVLSFNLNSEGKFEFLLDNKDLLKDTYLTQADVIASMGQEVALPVYQAEVKAIVRVDFGPSSFTGEVGETLFNQIFIPFNKKNLRIANSDLSLGDNLPMTSVFFRKVKFIDSLGQPISGVESVGFNNGIVGENTKAKTWTQDNLRPVIATSDQNGEVYIYPLTAANVEATFSFVASKEGYCTFVSTPQIIRSETPIAATLYPCEINNKWGLRVATSYEGLGVFNHSLEGSGEAVQVIYSIDSSFKLDLASFGPTFSSTTINFYEGLVKSGVPVPEVASIVFGQSENYPNPLQSQIDLPILPDNGASSAGRFTTMHLSMPRKDSNGNIIESFDRYLFFRTKTSEPNFKDLMADLQLVGDSGEVGVASGLEGKKFYASSRACAGILQIGIGDAANNRIYKPCVNNLAEFTASELGIATAAGGAGGDVKLRFFLKDIFGNESIDSPVDENTKILFFDNGIPDLESSPFSLQFELGFIASSTPAGTDDEPTSFPLGVVRDGSSDTIILDPNNISSFVFRFQKPSGCFTKSGVVGDDTLNSGNRGITIAKFKIGSSDTALASTSPIKCTDGNATLDFQLTADSISFPSDTNGKAVFYLQVADLAGNESAKYAYEISPCTPNIEATGGLQICWKN